MSRRTLPLPDALVFGLMLIAPAGLCLRPLLAGSIPDFMDPVMYFFPLRWHAASLLLDGQMPWWNRSILTGTPLYSNPQAALAYPFNWPMLAWPGGPAYSAPLLLQLGLFGAGTFLLLRRAGAGMAASILAGGLALAGQYGWTCLQLGNFMNVLPWWPLWLVAGLGFCRSRKSGPLTGGALAVAMMILAGAHQLAIYGALGLALCVAPLLTGPDRGRWAGFAIGSGLLGLLIAAPGWFPQWAYLRETSRMEGLDVSSVLVGTLASPLEIVRQLAGLSGPTGGGLSVGAFALIVGGVLPADAARRRLWVGAWVAVVVTALLSWRPAAAAALDLIPGYGAFHDPKRILGVTQWLLIVAAGLGTETLAGEAASSARSRWARTTPALLLALIVMAARGGGSLSVADAPAALAVILVVLLNAWPGAEAGTGGSHAIRSGIAAAAAVAALALLVQSTARSVAVEWRSVSDLIGDGPPELLKRAELGPGERFFAVDWKRDSSYDFRRPDLRDAALPNLAMLWGLEDVGGYEPARSPRYDRWLASAAPWPGGRQPWRDWFGLVYPPPAGTPEFEMFAEANPRAGLVPRWGLPVYLVPLDAARWGGVVPAWRLDLDLHVLFRPAAESAEGSVAARGLAMVDALGGVHPRPFRPEAQRGAQASLIGTTEDATAVQTDPSVQVQVVPLGRPPEGKSWAGIELRLPAAEFPAWAFLWSLELSEAYRPEEERGLQLRLTPRGGDGWARMEGVAGSETSGEVLAREIRANRLGLRVRWDAESPGTLRIHDAWWPGWRAWVRGEAAEVRPSGETGGGPWREIAIPPGESEVLLTYEPPLLRAALWICCGGLLALLMLGVKLDRDALREGNEGPGPGDRAAG